MSARSNPRVKVELGRRSAWIYGRGADVVPALKACRSPRQWNDTLRCWSVPISHVSDVLAAIENRIGGDVEVVEVDR